MRLKRVADHIGVAFEYLMVVAVELVEDECSRLGLSLLEVVGARGLAAEAEEVGSVVEVELRALAQSKGLLDGEGVEVNHREEAILAVGE